MVHESSRMPSRLRPSLPFLVLSGALKMLMIKTKVPVLLQHPNISHTPGDDNLHHLGVFSLISTKLNTSIFPNN